jgi:hypothetical protein
VGRFFLSKNPHILNYFLNHTAVHPNIAPDGTGYIDAAAILALPDTYFFNFGAGAVLLIADGTDYKLDAYFPRNRGAKKHIKAALDFMAEEGANRFVAEIPSFNRPSMHMCVSLGFKRVGIAGAWLKDGVRYDVIRYELEIE